MTEVKLKTKDIAPLRNKLLVQNKNICPLCEHVVVSPCLDHDHGNGKVRNTICRGCNSYLGVLENKYKRFGLSIQRRDNLINNFNDYIKNLREEIHPTHGKIKRRKNAKSKL